jgi:hypothetical protein
VLGEKLDPEGLVVLKERAQEIGLREPEIALDPGLGILEPVEDVMHMNVHPLLQTGEHIEEEMVHVATRRET